MQAAQGSADPSASSSAAAAATSSSQAQHAQQAPSKEEEEERRGLVCMVCKEGYASRPKELLAAYCYCMKLRSGEGFGAVPEVWRGPNSSTKPDALQVIRHAYKSAFLIHVSFQLPSSIVFHIACFCTATRLSHNAKHVHCSLLSL